MMVNVRRIEPLLLNPKNLILAPIQVFEPQLLWVYPNELYIEEGYQRTLSRSSLALIKKLVATWDWTAYNMPRASRNVDGKLVLLDGQHTSIAAATHPHIEKIPVLLASWDLGMKDKAAAYVRINEDRRAVTPLELFKAKVEAGDDDAISLDMAAKRAKVVLANASDVASGSRDDFVCYAFSTCKAIVKKRGTMVMRQIFDVCVAANLRVIRAHYLYAIEALVYEEKYRGKYNADALALVIREYPYVDLEAHIVRASLSGGFSDRKEASNKKKLAISLIKQRYDSIYG